MPTLICGLDEVGRGPLAGPLVAAAVILSPKHKQQLLNSKLKIRDSKKLTPLAREKIYKEITDIGISYCIESMSVEIINDKGITYANKKSIENLINNTEADKYIVDGNLKLNKLKGKSHLVTSMIQADTKILEVMLASIIAKVTRDAIMHQLHHEFPMYGWNTNAGYGTKAHQQALLTHGSCRYHRNIFVTTAMRKQ